MNVLEKYYEENLYPLQNGVLNIVKKSGTPFFLTGGTALSRYYVHHRYSDDLDLFVINDPDYSSHVTKLLKSFVDEEVDGRFKLGRSGIVRGKDFTQLFMVDKKNPEVELNIDLVNDVAAHYGRIIDVPILGRIDSMRNILSNKLTALFRSEPKDVVDIQAIAKIEAFNWKSIVNEAKSKEAGVEPEVVYDLLMSFPIKHLDDIKWIKRPEDIDFEQDVKTIANDILFGRENSLYFDFQSA